MGPNVAFTRTTGYHLSRSGLWVEHDLADLLRAATRFGDAGCMNGTRKREKPESRAFPVWP